MKKTHVSGPNGLTTEGAPPTVGFRLDEEHRRELGKRALKAGVSPHDLARLFVVAALHDREELPTLRAAILALESEIAELRRDLALSVESLLLSTEADTPENIRTWIRKNLRSE